MNKRLAKQIYRRCPLIFRASDSRLIDYRGFEVCDGWYWLVYNTCVAIEAEAQILLDEGVPRDKLPHPSQIKEKFGGLRFYCGGNEAIRNIISEAESASVHICYRCGAPGKIRDHGYVVVLCNQCNDRLIKFGRDGFYGA